MSNYEFTSNFAIDCIEMEDNMIEFTGFVDEVKNKELATNKAYVMRIILNNNEGKRVQVVAWANYISKLEKFAELYNVIQIEGAVSSFISMNSKYNAGNVSFQLTVKDYTTLTKVGVFNPSSTPTNVPVVTFDNILSFKESIIKIEGYIKNAFRILESKYQKIIVGSITDGNQKLEIHVTEIPSDLTYFDYIHKGSYVSISGVLIKKDYGPIFLKVEKINNIQHITSKQKQSFDFIYHGYKSIED